jgi:serine/threonine protein kinase
MADREGQLLGHYRLAQQLGAGGFAEVYLAEHRYLHTQAAIKVLHLRLTEEDQQRFLREAQTIARLRHPHIVQVFDFGLEGGAPYLVMDYAPGGTLRARHPRGTRLSPGTILAYVRQIADAVQYAHDQHLIHRDLKPENLLLGRAGEVLLSDFGIATISQTTSEVQTQGYAGTATYAAPEQLRGKPVPASDQYALGVLVYEWLSGHPPFHGSPLEVAIQQVLSPPPPLHEQLPEIAPAVEQVVLTALSKEPKARFGSMRALATALEQAIQSAPPVLALDGPAAPGAAQPKPEQAGPPGGASIYFAPTQLIPPTPPLPLSQRSTLPEQSTAQTGRTPAPSPLPATTGSAAGAVTTPPDDASATPSPAPDQPDAKAPAAPGTDQEPPRRTSPPAHHWRRSRGRVMLLVSLAVLLIGGGTLLYATVMQNQAIAAAQANATATANAQVNAQDTAAANVFATATTQAQATAGVIQTATSGFPLYFDPLLEGNTTDPTWTNDGTNCFFAADGYHVHINPPPQANAYPLCLESDRAFQDATITVDMVLRGGYSGGLLFRWNTNQGYFFEVGAGGNYQLSRWDAPGALQAWTDAPAIHPGLFSSNTLEVIARGSVFFFYVNGMFLTEVQDATYGLGTIGLVSFGDTSTGPGEAVFSNLKVYYAP